MRSMLTLFFAASLCPLVACSSSGGMGSAVKADAGAAAQPALQPAPGSGAPNAGYLPASMEGLGAAPAVSVPPPPPDPRPQSDDDSALPENVVVVEVAR